jgi:dUTP pyrophosphatase
MLFQVKIKKLSPTATIPTWGSTHAAGADLYADNQGSPFHIKIEPQETKLIPLGISSEFDPGHAAFIFARSGLATKKGLAPANKVGVIDADYRGEWMVPLHNHSHQTQYIEHGERIAQVVFKEIERPQFVDTEELTDTERGDGGFGSTGSH